MVGTAQTRLCPPYVALLPAHAGQLDGDMRRSADDPRAAIGIGRAPLGQAPDRFQKQHVLFGEHGISSSAVVSPLVWRDAGDLMSLPCCRTSISGRFRGISKMASSVGRNVSSRLPARNRDYRIVNRRRAARRRPCAVTGCGRLPTASPPPSRSACGRSCRSSPHKAPSGPRSPVPGNPGSES